MRVLQCLRSWRFLLTFILVVPFSLLLAYPGSAATAEAALYEMGRVAISDEPASFPFQRGMYNFWGTPERAPSLSLQASAAYGGIYRVGSWVPVHVTLQNSGTDITTDVHVQVPGGATFATTLELPNGAHKSITIYAFVHRFVRHLKVQVVRSDSVATDAEAVLTQERITLDPQNTRKEMIATIAGDGSDNLQLPRELTNGTLLTQVSLSQTDLPDQAAGLSTFDALILNNVSTLELSEEQRRALCGWVLQGGRLVVGGGTEAQRTLEGLPEELRPVDVHAIQQINAEVVLGTASPAQSSLTLAQAEPVAGTPPAYIPANMAIPQHHATSSTAEAEPFPYPLLVARSLGKGSVAFFAASLSEPALLTWPDQQHFWSDLLKPDNVVSPFSGSPDIRPESFTEGHLASALTRLPALELPSLLTLGLLLLIYIVLVGPVTYLVLRRLDKQAWGWVVVPVLTIIVAAVAYGLSYAQRGGDILINQITLIEPLSSEIARARSFVGVFSPEQRTYTLEASYPTATTSITSAQQTVLLRPISLHGPWSMQEQEPGGIFFQQPAAEESSAGPPASRTGHASGVNIGQWSMRGIMSDNTIAHQEIAVHLRLDGDEFSGEVHNNSPYHLEDVVLVQGNYIIRLGNLEPGARQTTDELILSESDLPGDNNKFEHSPLSYIIYEEQIDLPSGRYQPPSPDIQQRMAVLDAIFPYERPHSMQPLFIAWARETPLDVQIPDERIINQQLSLITFTPPITVESNQITLSQGWFRREVDSHQINNQHLCMGSQGIGFILFDSGMVAEPIRETLRLPGELAALRPDELNLLVDFDGQKPRKIIIDLFDWTSGEWVTKTIPDDTLMIEEPERFLSSSGEMRLQFDPSEQNPSQNSDCFFIDATVRGTLNNTDM